MTSSRSTIGLSTLQIGEEYEIIDPTILYEKETPGSRDEVCGLPRGATVMITGKGTDRIQIKYGNYSGWMNGEKPTNPNEHNLKKKVKGFF